MKHYKIAASLSALTLALTVAAPSYAASVLIQRKDGREIPEVIPKGACEFAFYVSNPDSTRLQDRVFPMQDGTVAVNTNKYGGYFWSVSTQAGPEVTINGKDWEIRWHFALEKEKPDPWRRKGPDYDWTAISSLKLHEARQGTPEACTGYINEDAMRFFGNRLQDVDKLTFFTKDDGAFKIVEKKNKEETTRLDGWRKTITPGTDTHCGMAIEVKPPLLKVQTPVGEKWFKTGQLYPPREKQCVFKNGEYQG